MVQYADNDKSDNNSKIGTDSMASSMNQSNLLGKQFARKRKTLRAKRNKNGDILVQDTDVVSNNSKNSRNSKNPFVGTRVEKVEEDNNEQVSSGDEGKNKAPSEFNTSAQDGDGKTPS